MYLFTANFMRFNWKFVRFVYPSGSPDVKNGWGIAWLWFGLIVRSWQRGEGLVCFKLARKPKVETPEEREILQNFFVNHAAKKMT